MCHVSHVTCQVSHVICHMKKNNLRKKEVKPYKSQHTSAINREGETTSGWEMGADDTAKLYPWVMPAQPSRAGLYVHLLWQRRQDLGAAAEALVLATEKSWDYLFLVLVYATFKLGSELS